MANDSSASTEIGRVQEAVEMLLLKKNLGKDPYLRSAINPQMYIPVGTLTAHEKLRELNATEDLVIEAAKRSHRLGYDEKTSMIRPMLKSKRNTLILRDIPEDMKESEIMALFEREGAPKAPPIKLTQEVNQTWFAKFESDEDLAETAVWVRSQKINDQSVQCAIKSEYFLRSFFPLQQHSMLPNPQIFSFDNQASPHAAPYVRYDESAQSGSLFQQQPQPLQPSLLPILTSVNSTENLGGGLVGGGIVGDPMDSPISNVAVMPPIQGSWRLWGVDRPPLVFEEDDDDIQLSDGFQRYKNNWWETNNQWWKSKNDWNETRWSGNTSNKGKEGWPAAKGKGKAQKRNDGAAPPPPPWTWDSAPKWESFASQSKQWTDNEGWKRSRGPKWQPKSTPPNDKRKDNESAHLKDPLSQREEESIEEKKDMTPTDDKEKLAYSKEVLLKVERAVTHCSSRDEAVAEAEKNAQFIATIPRVPPFPT